jgi:hypothetical protein
LKRQAAAIEASYRQLHDEAIRALRAGHTGDELRAVLRTQEADHPRLMQAVADAEQYIAAEVARRAQASAWATPGPQVIQSPRPSGDPASRLDAALRQLPRTLLARLRRRH